MTLHYFNKGQKTADGNTLRSDQDLVSSALCILHLFAGMTRLYIEETSTDGIAYYVEFCLRVSAVETGYNGVVLCTPKEVQYFRVR